MTQEKLYRLNENDLLAIIAVSQTNALRKGGKLHEALLSEIVTLADRLDSTHAAASLPAGLESPATPDAQPAPREAVEGGSCQCPQSIKTGQTSIMCCNICGLPDEAGWQPKPNILSLTPKGDMEAALKQFSTPEGKPNPETYAYLKGREDERQRGVDSVGVNSKDAEVLKSMMALVRAGYQQAADEIFAYLNERKVSPDFMDGIVRLLSTENKKAFVFEVFQSELNDLAGSAESEGRFAEWSNVDWVYNPTHKLWYDQRTPNLPSHTTSELYNGPYQEYLKQSK